ncbi:MAG: histidinol-phosphate transaminase [Blastocatellia bacterium]|nr:histidinol-phosphate transaminase [Blastocatellia bacterium]
MSFQLDRLVRENIRRLRPYSSARSEFAGDAEVFLDANENAFGSPVGNGLNRYPDPLQMALKARIAELRRVGTDQVFIGNGSDEAVDLLFRIFCRPGVDNVITCPPTYGMYEVSAGINDIAVNHAPLNADFGLNAESMLAAVGENTKLVFVCSPNNPTGNLMDTSSVTDILQHFPAIVVIDEAYIDFAATPSWADRICDFPNLIVLQTLSKAWGLAGLRVGTAFADANIIALMNKVKPPYNVSRVSQELALTALENTDWLTQTVTETVSERKKLEQQLNALSFVQTVYPSDANFLLVRVSDAAATYRRLIAERIVVRDRSKVELCEGCLRITIGTAAENQLLMEALRNYETSIIY